MSHLVYQLHNNYATYAEFDHLFFFFKKPPSVHCPHSLTSFHYNTIKLGVLFLGVCLHSNFPLWAIC